MSFSALATEKKLSTQEQYINQVEYLFKGSPEKLNYNEVVKLSNDIFLQRTTYPNKIIAKTYLLLANVASNKGDLETAYQFTQDGLATTVGQDTIKLSLLIKLASILLAKRQYNKLLKTVQQAIDIQKKKENTKYHLFALSYRSVAFAMLNQHEKALSDLKKVEYSIKQNPSFAEHISLLAILARAHYHLGDYQIALTVNMKILQLRFSLNKLENVDQTYYHLANAYYRLNRFNDAYNAYWEAKSFSEKKSAHIYAAFAIQGLGLTLIKQKQYVEAKVEILKARALFYQNNVILPYLESTISLAILSNLTDQKSSASKLLFEAEKLSINIELSDDYIILYQLLSDIYKESEDIKKAFIWQQKYSTALLKERKSTAYIHQLSTKHSINSNVLTSTAASNQSSQLAVKLAEKSELASSYSTKYHQQQILIFVLSVIALLLFSFFKQYLQSVFNKYFSISCH
jgi:tetratricopeptide (TPR) repeat protein